MISRYNLHYQRILTADITLKKIITMYILYPRLSEVDGAGACPDNEKAQITQMYLCNANKIK